MPERVVRLQDITETFLSDNPQADIDIIWKAYVYSAKVHRGQTRLSGSPYLFHPLEVAYILSQMKLDTCTIAAGLLHDTVEDVPQVTIEEIGETFGEEVAFLVDGVTKIGRMSFSSTEERQAENFRKIILAMAKDIRVILIKLADRLHNMRTIEYQPPEKRREISQETLDIYAPIAHRLGIGWLKSELEDLSFKCLHPENYDEIQRKIERSFEERDRFIGEIRKLMVAELESIGIPGRVEGRPKHIYSIFRKIKRQDIEFHDVYDLTALRVITDTVRSCYAILGSIHSLWQPIPGRFKDFIALPKPNMYQSLHTTVIGPKGERVEFQIRTEEMHRIAEEGIAAHWRYKAGLSKEKKNEEGLLWLRRMLDWQQETKDPKEFMDALRIDLFPDEVYVFTPKGAVKNLPRGSTPVDFAYSVHTEVGDQCVGARVNHRMVALEYQLKSGDIVEILTSSSHTPSRDWLKFVQTSKAKARIRNWIKLEQKERSRELGQEILEKQLQKYGLEPEGALKGKERDLSEVARRVGFTSWEELLAGVGFGKVSAVQVIHKLFPEEELEKKLEKKKREKLTLKTLMEKVVTRKSPHEGIRVKGVDDILVRFARCCSPVPGDEIIGYITRGRGISVHIIDCPTMAGLSDDSERKIEIEWEGGSTRSFPIRIKVETVDRPGMLSKISSAIAAWDVNISWANVETSKDGRALLDFILEIKSLEELNKVLRSIREVKGVLTVERVRDLSWMPEEEDLS